jgi:signal transduction histidine kinase
VKVIQNMTQQRQREAELERLHATLEQRVQERTHELEQAIVQLESFSYSISHDLRGPLRAMQGFASILIEDYASQLDDTGRHYLERISVAAQRMDRLVQDVLTLSRIQRASLPCVTVSLDRLVPELVDQHRQLHPDVARIRIDHPLLPVQAHEPSLIQCLTNLLTNAVKFARPGVPLEIHFSTELLKGDDLVRIRVRDNGVGIRREDQDRIFSIFEQVRNGNAASEGTGIGLAIVKAAVERMGGRVGVVSDFGKGSSFYVDLPPAEK